MEYSPLQKDRFSYTPNLPPVLNRELSNIKLNLGEPTESAGDQDDLKLLFARTYGKPAATFIQGEGKDKSEPLIVGVILSGGQAPGGHNVIAGIYDGLKKGNPGSVLLGFRGGPSGILKDDVLEITGNIIDEYRNTGGFDMIGSGRTKLETEEQFQTAIKVLTRRKVNALVVIGGDDSNTNAALLAEYFVKEKVPIQVIGVPKTIDGDLKNQYIETSFGFDTATKTYAELIGNIERDANSAKKYWHFIKLMGRSASHIALECALQTHPNVTLISEEIAEDQQSLDDIIECIVNVIVKRSEKGENFGVVLVPEGLIEFIPEMKRLIGELNDLLAHHQAHYATLNTFEDQSEWVNKNLSRDSSYVFSSLPTDIQRQLLMDRDPHGNVQVSRIETEKLLIEMVSDRLKEMKNEGRFSGKFSSQSHFFGYEGRCAFPSNFDADYCYSLGFTAFLLIAEGLTGYISAVRNLVEDCSKWEAGGIPLVMMMNMEQRHGFKKPVIRKALVETDSNPFKTFKQHRETWALETSFRYPGAIQYYGPTEICNSPTITLKLERS
ncbi:MAG: diphosphate--fructose-6-phosphate 1-phosphotransferase [Spirochaetia bacterium]